MGSLRQRDVIEIQSAFGRHAIFRDPYAWFYDVLSRIAAHSIQQLDELLPHRWAAARH